VTRDENGSRTNSDALTRGHRDVRRCRGLFDARLIGAGVENARMSRASGSGHLGDSRPPRGRGSKWNLARLLLAPERARTCRILRRNPLGGTKKFSDPSKAILPAARGLPPSPSPLVVHPLKMAPAISRAAEGQVYIYHAKKSRRENRPARLNNPIAGIRNSSARRRASRRVIFTPLNCLLGGNATGHRYHRREEGRKKRKSAKTQRRGRTSVHAHLTYAQKERNANGHPRTVLAVDKIIRRPFLPPPSPSAHPFFRVCLDAPDASRSSCHAFALT